MVLLAFLLVLGIAGAGVYAFFTLGDDYVQTKSLGTHNQDDRYVPKNYGSDLVHLLIAGIDNEEGRSYGEGRGLTDMLLYARFDFENNRLNMIQIPRDSYVGEDFATGGTGKINALLNMGPDNQSPINNLTGAFEQLFQLPVDHYIAMDMDALKTIVDTFGGIEVYVSRDMQHDGSYLQQGWRVLDGASAEFFVRNRYGAGFERSDIDRLDNQRYFYSALFKRFLTATPGDLVKLMPVFAHYCSTDLSLTDLIDLAFSCLSLTAENVLFCKAPGATGPQLDPTGANRSNYYLDLYGRGTEEEPGLANLLDTYFRPQGAGVPPAQLMLPKLQIPAEVALYPPNVQSMGAVQNSENEGL